MIKQQYRYSSLNLELAQFTKIFSVLEKECVSITKKGEFANLTGYIKLRDSTTIDVSTSKELEAVVNDEIGNIRNVSVRLYSSELEVNIDERVTLFRRPVEVSIKTKTRERLVVLRDAIQHELIKSKSWNWMASSWSITYPFSFIFWVAFQIGVIDAITTKLSANTQAILAFVIILIGFALAALSSSALEHLYPNILLRTGQKKSGRELKGDIVWVVIVIAIPIAINVIFP